jgi:hypothetical protein
VVGENPKAESRNQKSEGNPKPEIRKGRSSASLVSDLGFSSFLRISGLGLRISNQPCRWLSTIMINTAMMMTITKIAIFIAPQWAHLSDWVPGSNARSAPHSRQRNSDLAGGDADGLM